MIQFPRARRSLSLRAEFRFCPIVVIRCAAQQSGGVASVRERQVGVAVRGSGVSRVPAQFGFTTRRWFGPPFGLQPQYAGQCGDQG